MIEVKTGKSKNNCSNSIKQLGGMVIFDVGKNDLLLVCNPFENTYNRNIRLNEHQKNQEKLGW